MSKSTKPKEEEVEPIVETTKVEENTPVVDEVPVTVEEPVLEETVEPEVVIPDPVFVPEIPAQAEESSPIVEEGKIPLHKLNKIRS